MDSTCSSCGKTIQDDAKFCHYCGHEAINMTEPECPDCGKFIPIDANFCPYCKHSVAASKDNVSLVTCEWCDKETPEKDPFCVHCGTEKVSVIKSDQGNRFDKLINDIDESIKSRDSKATFDYKCPNCKSDNIKSLPLAHSEGLSDVSLITNGAGIGLGANGIGFGLGSSSTKGTNQSRLSGMISPPTNNFSEKLLKIAAILIIIGVISVCNDAIILGSIVILLAIISFGIAMSRDSNEYTVNKANWQSSYLCLRCGFIVCPNPIKLDKN
jgi:RNA polymerase subunit RPABC4/transcription elongation factor Spt4